MREPGPKQVALVVDEHLGLVHQPAKCRGMYDAVAVTLIFGAVRRRRFEVAAAAGLFFACGIRRQFHHAPFSVMRNTRRAWPRAWVARSRRSPRRARAFPEAPGARFRTAPSCPSASIPTRGTRRCAALRWATRPVSGDRECGHARRRLSNRVGATSSRPSTCRGRPLLRADRSRSEWPKFNNARTLLSRSSWATTAALISQALPIA